MTTNHTAAAKTDPTKAILKAASPADFLAALPRLIGFDATESCFIIGFEGDRTAGSARIDLPIADLAQGNEEAASQWFITVAAIAQKFESVVFVVKSTTELTATPKDSIQGFIAGALSLVGDGTDVHLKGIFAVGEDGWSDFTHKAPILRPLDEITASHLYDPSYQGTTLEEWRAANPDQTSRTVQTLLDALDARK